MNLLIRKAFIVDLLVLTQLLCPFFFYLTQSSFVLYFFVSFIPVNLYILFKYNNIKIKYFFGVILFYFILLIFGLLGKSELNAVFFSLILISINNFILPFLSKSVLLKRMLSIVFFIIAFYVLILGILNGFDPNFGNEILGAASRNYVSAILILYFIAYLVLSLINKEKASVILALLLVFDCIILYGRTGVLISSLLLLFTIYLKFNKIVFYSMLISLLMIAGAIYSYVSENTGFSGGLETPRTQMLNEYLQNMSSLDILFGRSFYECCNTVVFYGVNPHNSFIAGHHVFGIFHTIVSILILLIVYWSRCYYFLFLLGLIYLRYWYDVLGLFYILDFPICFMLAHALNNIKNSKA